MLVALGLEGRPTPLDQVGDGLLLGLSPGQFPGGLQATRLGLREGSLFGLAQDRVELQGPLDLLVMGELVALSGFDQDGIGQEAGIGLLQFLEEFRGLLQPGELEHIAQGGGRLGGLAGADVAPDEIEDQ